MRPWGVRTRVIAGTRYLEGPGKRKPDPAPSKRGEGWFVTVGPEPKPAEQTMTELEERRLAEVLDVLVSIQTVVNDLVRKAEQPDRYPAAFNIKKSAGPDA